MLKSVSNGKIILEYPVKRLKTKNQLNYFLSINKGAAHKKVFSITKCMIL